MKNIFNSIATTFKSIFDTPNTEETVMTCNYVDNYYGDQYCQKKVK